MSQQNQPSFALHHQNIIPFYLVEDKLRQNFTNISSFIDQQKQFNERSEQTATDIKIDIQEFKKQIDQKLVEVEKRIVEEIGKELDGRIIVAINKNMTTFTARMEEKENKIDQVTQGIEKKLEEMKKKIVYQSSKEQQSNITREVSKLQKKMKGIIQQVSKKTAQHSPSKTGKGIPSKGSLSLSQFSQEQSQGQPSRNAFPEQQSLRIRQLQVKTQKIQEFIIKFDKRFYENMSALKQSWKELGQDILQTKKKLATKQEEMRLDLVKLKGMSQFKHAPADLEQSFKKKLMGKFSDIYQLVGQLVTRTDMDSQIQRLKRTTARHDGELSDLREENSKNSDYFTFYINNSNTDDLSQQLKSLKEEVRERMTIQGEAITKQNEETGDLKNEIVAVRDGLEGLDTKEGHLEDKYRKLREDFFKQVQRIDALEQHNNFTPQKMAKIHNTLDIGFTPNEQDLLEKKQSAFLQNAAMKQLKAQVSKLKDEIFVLTNELTEVQKIKKYMNGLQGKMDKIKIDSQEAMLTRKPWVCLSCDKNQKEKQEQDRIRRDVSRKKLQAQKNNLFGNKGEKSQRLIKLIPGNEDKFQVYEKYREKYLSDAIKLPEIYREKIGDKQPVI